MGRYVIGVDGGGSKTAAVVMDERGQVLGRGDSGSSNYHLVGRAGVRTVLLGAMQEAVHSAGLDLSRAAAATWALAGAGRSAEVRLLEDLRAELLPGIPGQVENDAVAALAGGVGARYGVVLIAGTGMIVYGENATGDRARAGGWGHILDDGSGYGLAQAALRAVALATDGSDLSTDLNARILDKLKLEEPADLVNWVYDPGREVADIVALAPVVLAAAEAGDLVATEVVTRAAAALARAVDAVARRLALWEQPFPLVLAGGLLTMNDFYRRVITQLVRARVPQVQPMLPHADAAVGAALLALTALDHDLEPQIEIKPSPADAWSSERRNFLTQDRDLHSNLEMLGVMHLEDSQAVAAVRPNLPVIAKVVDAVAGRMSQGGRLIYVGAGTSGRLGVLDAAECPPTFDMSPGRVVGIIAGGEKALTTSAEFAEDDPNAGRQAIAEMEVDQRDSVVGIAASGRTPYVIGALEEARRRGALTTALVCNLPAPMAQVADHLIAPLVGPEVITGSTRLKAGTAQKLVLNMLSTGVMVRLGKTYGNLMVDMRQQNVKLQHRARRIVAQACDISEAEAGTVLTGSQGAPLVSSMDWQLLRRPGHARAVQNIGGIANVTYLPPDDDPVRAIAFDTGPGNMLIDYAATRASGGAQSFDQDGRLASTGKIDNDLLAELMNHPYLAQPLPKTTGREQFGIQFGAKVWDRAEALGLSGEDIVATLTAFTATSIADAYRRFLPTIPGEVILGGGGTHNPSLVAMLTERLAPARVTTHQALGFPDDAKEAITMAMLAYEAIHGRPGNLPACTGAGRQLVLGKITPGTNYKELLRNSMRDH